jgi:hypothetical protein
MLRGLSAQPGELLHGLVEGPVVTAAPRCAVPARRRTLGAPRFAGAATDQFVKTIIDGVTTALHAHEDVTSAADVAERLATMTPLRADQVAALLLNDERASLGVCKRLVVLRGHGVQCQPQDGRISALRIEIDRLASAWQLTGEIVRR